MGTQPYSTKCTGIYFKIKLKFFQFFFVHAHQNSLGIGPGSGNLPAVNRLDPDWQHFSRLHLYVHLISLRNVNGKLTPHYYPSEKKTFT